MLLACLGLYPQVSENLAFEKPDYLNTGLFLQYTAVNTLLMGFGFVKVDAGVIY